MKPQFHRVPVPALSSFSIRHDKTANFGSEWHYHPELELHYVIQGEGVRLIGDNISNFSSGELILLGENLPHMWQSNESYYQSNPSRKVEAMIFHFLPYCLGQDFLSLPEAYLLPVLFEKAKKGMSIYGDSKKRIIDLMMEGQDASEFKRLLILISTLKILAETTEYFNIATPHAFYKNTDDNVVDRINKVCSYSLLNFKKEITLEEIANIANLSVTSFCRYFKTITKKTYYDFLIEIRVSHACRMLIEDLQPTEIICFECGFNNVSNFYRHFKKITNMTPLEYKRKYHSKKLTI